MSAIERLKYCPEAPKKADVFTAIIRDCNDYVAGPHGMPTLTFHNKHGKAMALDLLIEIEGDSDLATFLTTYRDAMAFVSGDMSDNDCEQLTDIASEITDHCHDLCEGLAKIARDGGVNQKPATSKLFPGMLETAAPLAAE